MDSSEVDGVAPEWYSDLGPDLSQGDIVAATPYGLIDAPLTICRPPNADPKGKSHYAPYDQLTKHLDVEHIHARGSVSMGLVIWPDCQIDKLKNQGRPEGDWFVGVAPIHALSRIPIAAQEKVLALHRAQFFPLPPNPPAITEASYVDFRYIWSVRFSLLKDRRMALSEKARQALGFQLFWFFTEVRVTAAIPCPSCGKDVPSSELFKFKDDGEATDTDVTDKAK